MIRNVATCAVTHSRLPLARPLHVAASRHGPTTTRQLSGTLHRTDLRVLDDMTVWLLTWDSHHLMIGIDDLTGSDALFAAWICKRQHSAAHRRPGCRAHVQSAATLPADLRRGGLRCALTQPPRADHPYPPAVGEQPP